jgi:hypothetical protein
MKMKKAPKISLLVVLLSIATLMNAQTYRLEVGYNNPDRTGVGYSNTYFNGIRLGGTAEFDLKNNLSLLTGVLYNVVYSNKKQGYPNSTSVTYETFGHFVDIPLRINYTYPLTKDLKIFGFAGPNLNIGLAQSMKTISDVSSIPSEPFTDLYTAAVLNRLNFQLGAGGGVQWKTYQFKAGYDFGINNLNKVSGAGSLYQKGWYVSFAYQF